MSETTRLLHECLERWKLDIGEPFSGGYVSRLVTAATLPTTGSSASSRFLAGNVSRAEREPWPVIDPKPLSGEREFAVAPIVPGFELGAGAGTSSIASTG